MDNSRFMRHLPTEIGKMRSLVFWRLKADLLTNEVSGTLPTEIGQLSKLQQFVAGNNSISGTIPTEIVDMSSLRVFTFENNRVSGEPVTLRPPRGFSLPLSPHSQEATVATSASYSPLQPCLPTEAPVLGSGGLSLN